MLATTKVADGGCYVAEKLLHCHATVCQKQQYPQQILKRRRELLHNRSPSKKKNHVICFSNNKLRQIETFKFSAAN